MRVAWILVVALGIACGPRAEEGGTAPASAQSASARQARAPEAPEAPGRARPKIVVLGDSLTAGLGLPLSQAYPTLLQQKLDAARLNY